MRDQGLSSALRERVMVIKPVYPESLKIGDIICFKLSEPTSITHRIINITNEGFTTKGDANEDPDQWIVKKENIIGKLVFTIPFIGYIGYFGRTPIGFILLIILPASLIIIIEIRNIIKELKKTKPPPQLTYMTMPAALRNLEKNLKLRISP